MKRLTHPPFLCLLLAACGFCLSVSNSRSQATLPHVWDEADGNPVAQDGIRWRADHIWPDDPMDPAAYQPMVWSGSFWAPEEQEHRQGNWPRIAITNGAPLIVTAGNWDANPGRKIPALILAPESPATLRLEGQLRAKIFEGNRDVVLLILKRTDGFVDEITRVDLPDDTYVDFPSDSIQLAEGEELAIVPILPTNNAADIHLIDFAVTVE